VVFLAETIAFSGSICLKRTRKGQGYESVEGEEIDPFTVEDDEEKWAVASSRT
jgi:hypothetical protein